MNKSDFSFLIENKTIKKLNLNDPRKNVSHEECVNFAESISKNSTLKEVQFLNISFIETKYSKEIVEALSNHQSIETLRFKSKF
jgi:hypothetical protein